MVALRNCRRSFELCKISSFIRTVFSHTNRSHVLRSYCARNTFQFFSRMEVVVIGAGVFGAWTALSLSRAGHRVTLLDHQGPANDKSSSAGESRIIRSAYGTDDVYTVMARRALQLWADFFRKENRLDCFFASGVLWMAPSGQPGIWQSRKIFERLSIAHDWLDAAGVEKTYPQFKVATDTVALFEPDGGALLAERSVQAVLTAALRSGITYESAEVMPPVLESPRLVFINTTDGRRFSADHFVFACGSWLPKLFEVLRNVIRPTRQELFFFAIPEGANQLSRGGLPIWVDETEPKIAYGFPDLGNGLKLGFHCLGLAFDPDQPRHETRPDAIADAADYLAQRLPVMRGAHIKTTQVCHYENTANGDFLIDLHPGSQNVWLVGGGSGHGFKHAPAIAEYVLDLMSGGSRSEFRFSLSAKQTVTGRVL